VLSLITRHNTKIISVAELPEPPLQGEVSRGDGKGGAEELKGGAIVKSYSTDVHHINGIHVCFSSYCAFTASNGPTLIWIILSANNLLNSFQSAFAKHNSTKTTLLYSLTLLSMHDHVRLFRVCKPQLKVITQFSHLRHLSSVFGFVWFRITSTVLSWIKS